MADPTSSDQQPTVTGSEKIKLSEDQKKNLPPETISFLESLDWNFVKHYSEYSQNTLSKLTKESDPKVARAREKARLRKARQRARYKILDEQGVPHEYSIFALAQLPEEKREKKLREFNERFIPKTDREIELKREDIEKSKFPDAIIPRLYRDNKTYIPLQGMRKRNDGHLIEPKIQLFDILDRDGKILKTFRTLDAAAAYMDKTTDTYLSYRGPEKQLPDKKLMRSFSIKTLYDVYDSNGKIVKSFKSRVQAHNMAFKLGTKYETRIVK